MRKKKIIGIIMAIAILNNMVLLNVAKADTNIEYDSSESVVEEDRGILGQATSTVEQMESWARKKGGTETFISLARKYVNLAKSHGGVNPTMAYAQAALETGYGHFGGVIDESYKNPCGMKTNEGGSDTNPNAHMRFESWESGIGAHLDHLALYAGATGYPRTNTEDPRHFPYIKGKAKTVKGLTGTWASDGNYASKILRLMGEIVDSTSGGSIGGGGSTGPVKPEVTNKRGTVNASQLNVRSGKGTNYKVIGSLKRGSKVEIIESSNGWHKIKYGNSYGYVSMDYVTIDGGETVNPPKPEVGTSTKGVVTASRLNIRSGKGTSYKVLGYLNRGVTVEIVESSNGWHKIKTGNGYGYVSMDYIRIGNEEKPQTGGNIVTASVLNVRSGKGTSYRVIGSLKRGNKVQIVETSKGWHKIKYGNGYGYVSAEYIN